MRFWIGGPRILGLRTGVSLGREDFGRFRRSSAVSGQITGSFVYVIRGAHNLVKIGISTNPTARLATLRTASPYPIDFAFVGATNSTGADIEAEAHRILGRYRVAGEWFDVSPELAIAAVTGAAAKLSLSLVPVSPNQIDTVIRMAVTGAAGQSVGPKTTALGALLTGSILLVVFGAFTVLSAIFALIIQSVIYQNDPQALGFFWLKVSPFLGVVLTYSLFHQRRSQS